MALKSRWNWREARPCTTSTKATRTGDGREASPGFSSHWTFTLALPGRGRKTFSLNKPHPPERPIHRSRGTASTLEKHLELISALVSPQNVLPELHLPPLTA